MKNMSYSDIMSMPTYERRFFLGLLTRDVKNRQERYEEQKTQTQTSKGTRKTRVSGEALKTKIKKGNLPTN